MKISYQTILASKLHPQRKLREHVVAMLNDGNIVQVEVGHGYRAFQNADEFAQWYDSMPG
ncbi:hypothetical protein ACLPHM_02870 [Paenalcaligenes sp. Me131]|uniref:hypothetical protein n=1 Tax=Paenalcaligenes sp. Me131 TaxID=3392636 RepID=UPI003D2E8911